MLLRQKLERLVSPQDFCLLLKPYPPWHLCHLPPIFVVTTCNQEKVEIRVEKNKPTNKKLQVSA